MKILLFIFLFIPTFVFANYIDTYSCGNCNENDMKALAKAKAPPLKCYFTNPPGTIPTPIDQVCEPTYRTIIVANSIDRMAFKYKVESIPGTYSNTIVKLNDITISPLENELLQEWYSIDNEFRSLGNYTFTHQPTYSSYTTFDKLTTSNYASPECADHPSSYMSNSRKQLELYKDMSSVIQADMGSQSWNEYTTDTSVTGGGITFGKGSVGFNITLTHKDKKVFAHNIWDANNYFSFEASYVGHYELNGQSTLQLAFTLQKSASAVDGMTLEAWYLPRNDFSNIPISNCMREYIDDIAQSSQVIPSGSPGGSTGGSTGGATCIKKTIAYGCTPWSCGEQVFLTLTACD